MRAGKNKVTTFLGQLRRDTRGNTLAMMAIALIPVSALAGSAVDMGRLYVVKVRLQQACDAGVLAGRKFMTDSASSTLDATAAARATTFFNNNFTSGWMRTNAISFTPSKTSDNQVAGVASVNVPMTVMKMFKAADVTLNVTCEARFDLADSDIMFVLDTTGSMACAPEDGDAGCAQENVKLSGGKNQTPWYVTEKTNSKLSALRSAVVDFDTTMRSNSDPSTHIRYGFVSYSSAVNVGRVIPAQFMVSDAWGYDTRELVGETNSGANDAVTLSGYTSGNCSTANRRYPAGSPTASSSWFSNSTAYYITNATWSQSACRANKQVVIPIWRYRKRDLDVSQYITGNTITNPIRLDGSTTSWDGCIEERATTASSSFDIDNLPPDLDPDLIPTAGDDSTLWRATWPDVTWQRNNINYEDSAQTDEQRSNDGNGRNYGDDYLASRGYSTCGFPARTLAVMSASDVSGYVNNPDFRPLGGTYHDVGMIWGVRMLSPNGIFSSTTAAWPGRNPPSRHIVFMTDGQMAPNASIYGQYGVEAYNGRVGNGTTNVNTLTARHTARFRAVCSYAKDRLNMTIWVVALGTTLSSDLNACASPGGHAFTATSKTELQEAFKTIATQVAQLRVSK